MVACLEGCITGCIAGVGANAGPGCKLLDAMGTGSWFRAVRFARGAGIAGIATDCSTGCGPVGGAVETGMTCCITCWGGMGRCVTGAGVDSKGWDVDGSISICPACTGDGKSKKGFA